MAATTLESLFHEILKDIYYAEKRLLCTMPKMADGAKSQTLTMAFERYADETQGQMQRLEKVFEMLGKRAENRTWPVMDGLIDEGLDFLQHYKTSPALDAGLLAAAHAIGHYEIGRYSTLKRWAEVLGLEEAAKLLDESLQEKSRTNQCLTALADRLLKAETLKETLTFEAVPPAAFFPEAA